MNSEHAMPAARPSKEHDSANPKLRAAVQIVGLTITLFWALAVLALFAELVPVSGSVIQVEILTILFATPLFIIFVVPALIYSQWGGPSGAKVGAALLLGGFAVVVAVLMWPLLAPMFP
jgi:cobalamin synthase